MSDELNGKKIAFLATSGVDQAELTRPWEEIKAAGATVELVSLEAGSIQSVHRDVSSQAERFKVDKSVDDVNAADYHGLVIPGGVVNPDTLRTHAKAVQFVRDFFAQHKPVAAICHAPSVLIEAGVLAGRTVTSSPSLKTDLRNAGAEWVDREVVCDEALVTSRAPGDLDAFCAKVIEEFAEGRHTEQTA